MTLMMAKSGAPHAATEERLPTYAARYASAFLTGPSESRADQSLATAIVTALKADTRVVDAVAESIEPRSSAVPILYVGASDAGTEELLRGVHYHTARFSNPITFTVSVQEKDQQKYGPYDWVASTHYAAAWDGACLVVMWPYPPAKLVPLAGGQVVVDILRQACEAVDRGLFVQSLCQPGCRHLFNHTEMRVELRGDPSPDRTKGAVPDFEAIDDSNVKVVIPPLRGGHGEENVAGYVHTLVATTANVFAEMKNLAQRILELEGGARADLDDLLESAQERVVAGQATVRQRLRLYWRLGRIRRREQAIAARLWLFMARIEESRRKWMGERTFLERDSHEGDAALYRRFLQDDVMRVDSLDLSLMRAAVEDLTTHIDNRSFVVATLLAGAVVAAVGVFAATAG